MMKPTAGSRTIKVMFWPWPKVIYIENKNLLFSETADSIFNQILYVSFWVHRNKNLLTWCWSHDQDGRNLNIW